MSEVTKKRKEEGMVTIFASFVLLVMKVWYVEEEASKQAFSTVQCSKTDISCKPCTYFVIPSMMMNNDRYNNQANSPNQSSS